MKKFKYHLVSLIPDPVRNERINVGIIGCFEDKIKTHFIKSAHRITALHPHYDTSVLFEHLDRLIKHTEADNFQKHLASISDEFIEIYPPAQGKAANHAVFERCLSKLFDRLVKPCPRQRTASRNTRLKSDLTEKLRHRRYLGDNIRKGKIVKDFIISESEDLRADFAYQNGTLNIIETLDYRVKDIKGRFKDAALSAVKLDETRKKVDKKAIGIALYVPPTDDSAAITSHQSLLHDYFDFIYDYTNRNQVAEFFRRLQRDIKQALI